jgi:hypothetical protein
MYQKRRDCVVMGGFRNSAERKPRSLHDNYGLIVSISFSYNLKEYKRHGEGASADLDAAEEERKQVSDILAPYAERDRWNVDESGLFGFAPPDRGLASKQMKGKKSNKFQITVTFACNADGSEKLPIFYIGKSKQPRCFKKTSPQKAAFYYCNNKTAWMTSQHFEE